MALSIADYFWNQFWTWWEGPEAQFSLFHIKIGFFWYSRRVTTSLMLAGFLWVAYFLYSQRCSLFLKLIFLSRSWFSSLAWASWLGNTLGAVTSRLSSFLSFARFDKSYRPPEKSQNFKISLNHWILVSILVNTTNNFSKTDQKVVRPWNSCIIILIRTILTKLKHN
jgi:hypothetical protein